MIPRFNLQRKGIVKAEHPGEEEETYSFEAVKYHFDYQARAWRIRGCQKLEDLHKLMITVDGNMVLVIVQRMKLIHIQPFASVIKPDNSVSWIPQYLSDQAKHDGSHSMFTSIDGWEWLESVPDAAPYMERIWFSQDFLDERGLDHCLFFGARFNQLRKGVADGEAGT